MSDHIADANKMVSDTPRTEAVNQYLRTRRDYTKTDHEVWMNHGIQLERELNAANVEIEEKRKDVVWLATEKAKLENYVMQLEEAGDEMFKWSERVGQEFWMKAKEDKL